MEKVTEENIGTIEVGDTIRYHNGYGWFSRPITEWEVEHGRMHGDHNETADLLNPWFGKDCFIVKRAGNDFQI